MFHRLDESRVGNRRGKSSSQRRPLDRHSLPAEATSIQALGKVSITTVTFNNFRVSASPLSRHRALRQVDIDGRVSRGVIESSRRRHHRRGRSGLLSRRHSLGSKLFLTAASSRHTFFRSIVAFEPKRSRQKERQRERETGERRTEREREKT